MAPRVLPAFCAVVLAGCGGAAPPATTTAVSTPTTSPPAAPAPAAPAPSAPAPPRTRNWFELQSGDCVTALPQVELGDVAVPLVDCSAPHVAEVFLRVPVEVDAAVPDVADQKCRAGLPGYTGGRTNYSVTYLIDSDMDRTGHTPLPSTVICLLQSPAGRPLTGSAGHE